MKIIKFLVIIGLFYINPTVMSQELPGKINGPLYVFHVSGTIDPVIKEYIHEGFVKIREEGGSGALIHLDTPGGLLDATRDIVQEILNAPFPVIVYVSPSGARAASAGVFITISADVAAMAPLTHLGAAHPVSLGGGAPGMPKKDSPQKKSLEKVSGKETKNNSSVMAEKAVSDTAAYARALAENKGRNPKWAESAVRESASLTSKEALEKKVIDYVAKDLNDLFSLIKGKEIKKGGAVFQLDFTNVVRVPYEMSVVHKWLHILAHPNVAYLLLMLGFYALIYELASPGVGFGAVVGITSLIMAFFSLQILPLNYAGMALLIVGIILIASDLFVSSGGILSLGGILCFGIGSFMLFDPKQPYFRVSMELILTMVGATAVFFLFAIKKVLQARKLPVLIGREGLIGQEGEIGKEGMAYLHGEYWSVDCEESLAEGNKIRVKNMKGNKLTVEKIKH